LAAVIQVAFHATLLFKLAMLLIQLANLTSSSLFCCSY